MKKKIMIFLTLIMSLSVVTVKAALIEEYDYETIYNPGVYTKTSEIDGNAVVSKIYIDNNGKIKSVYLDRLIDEDYYYFDENNNIFVFVQGDSIVLPNSYRFIGNLNEYSSLNIEVETFTSIQDSDLIVGFNDDEISKLKSFDQSTSLSLIDSDYKESIDVITDYVILENGINGLDINIINDGYYPSSVDTTVSVKEEVLLIQETLDSIKIDKLPYSKENTTKGVYQSGAYTYYYPSIEDDDMNLLVVNMYINDNGYLEYIDIDKVVDGKINNQDDIYKNQIGLLTESLLINQSSKSYKLYDKDLNLLEIDETTGFTYKDIEEVYINQIDGFNLNVKYLISALNTSFNKLFIYNDDELIDGTHYVSSNGNMMTIVVDDKKVVNMTIDSVFEWSNAKVTINGENYIIYSYDKFEEYDNSNKKIITNKSIIFSNGIGYYSLIQDPTNNKQYLLPVFFGATYQKDDDSSIYKFDEASTISRIDGNLTKQTSAVNDNLLNVDYTKQIKLLSDYFLENQNPYSLDILNDNTTDSIDGLTIEVSDYVNLYALALRNATTGSNMYNIDTTSTDYLVNDITYPLVDGSYSALSEVPSSDGNFYLAYMTITNGKITSTILDSTVYQNFHLSTNLAEEYENYFVSYSDETKRTNFISYSEASYYISNFIDSYDVIARAYAATETTLISNEYSYEEEDDDIIINFNFLLGGQVTAGDPRISYYGFSDADEYNAMMTEFTATASEIGVTDIELYNYLNNYLGAINNNINSALKEKPEYQMNAIADEISAETKKFIVVDTLNDAIDSYYIDLQDFVKINDTYKITDIDFSNTDSIRLSYNETSEKLEIKIPSNIDSNTLATATMEITFEDYDVVTRDLTFKIVPLGAYYSYLLNDDDFLITLTDADDKTLVNKFDILSSSARNVVITTNVSDINDENLIKYDLELNKSLPDFKLYLNDVETNTLVLADDDENSTAKLTLAYDYDTENSDLYDIKKDITLNLYSESYVSSLINKALRNKSNTLFLASNNNSYLIDADIADILGLNYRFETSKNDIEVEHISLINIDDIEYKVLTLDDATNVTLKEGVLNTLDGTTFGVDFSAVDFTLYGNSYVKDDIVTMMSDNNYFEDLEDNQTALYLDYDETGLLKIDCHLYGIDYDHNIELFPRIVSNDETILDNMANSIKSVYVQVDETNSYDLSNIYSGDIEWISNNKTITSFDYSDLSFASNSINEINLKFKLSYNGLDKTYDYNLYLVADLAHDIVEFNYFNIVDSNSNFICLLVDHSDSSVASEYVYYDETNDLIKKVVIDKTKALTENDYATTGNTYDTVTSGDTVNGYEFGTIEKLKEMLISYDVTTDEEIVIDDLGIYYLNAGDLNYACVLANGKYISYKNNKLVTVTEVADGVGMLSMIDDGYYVTTDYTYAADDFETNTTITSIYLTSLLKAIN